MGNTITITLNETTKNKIIDISLIGDNIIINLEEISVKNISIDALSESVKFIIEKLFINEINKIILNMRNGEITINDSRLETYLSKASYVTSKVDPYRIEKIRRIFNCPGNKFDMLDFTQNTLPLIMVFLNILYYNKHIKNTEIYTSNIPEKNTQPINKSLSVDIFGVIDDIKNSIDKKISKLIEKKLYTEKNKEEDNKKINIRYNILRTIYDNKEIERNYLASNQFEVGSLQKIVENMINQYNKLSDDNKRLLTYIFFNEQLIYLSRLVYNFNSSNDQNKNAIKTKFMDYNELLTQLAKNSYNKYIEKYNYLFNEQYDNNDKIYKMIEIVDDNYYKNTKVLNDNTKIIINTLKEKLNIPKLIIYINQDITKKNENISYELDIKLKQIYYMTFIINRIIDLLLEPITYEKISFLRENHDKINIMINQLENIKEIEDEDLGKTVMSSMITNRLNFMSKYLNTKIQQNEFFNYEEFHIFLPNTIGTFSLGKEFNNTFTEQFFKDLQIYIYNIYEENKTPEKDRIKVIVYYRPKESITLGDKPFEIKIGGYKNKYHLNKY